EYELRYVYPPQEVEGYHPVWINRSFLQEAKFENKKLVVGDAQFSTLYCDVEYMDVRALAKVLEFAKQGLPVCMKRQPQQPGYNKSPDYKKMLNELSSLKNVSADFKTVVDHPPLISLSAASLRLGEGSDVGGALPEYWCRVGADGSYYLFLAQPLSKDLKYPVYSGQSIMKQSVVRELTLNVNGKTIQHKFEFKPYQSLMLKISPSGKMKLIDITFIPKDPVVRPHEPQKVNF
ncbi:MAG: hypothetical protein WCI97_12285, partial [Bacteroidota bacterium]